MPKKYSVVEKRKWLEKYEGGRSEVSIAGDARCDVRTIKKGIEEARHERDARGARAGLLKQALLSHQEKLALRLKEILSFLTMPDKDWIVLSWYRDRDSIFDEREHAAEDSPEETEIASKIYSSQTDLMQEMLQEHLRNDKMWRILARRDEAFATHRKDRITLQRQVVSLLEENTGYKIVDRNNVPTPFLYSYTAGDLFFNMTINWAFGNHSIDWQDEVVVNYSDGSVRYQNSILAEVPGKEEECRKKLLDAFENMQSLFEAEQVVASYQVLEKETMNAKRAIEEILVLGFIPGWCKVCRRLGL